METDDSDGAEVEVVEWKSRFPGEFLCFESTFSLFRVVASAEIDVDVDDMSDLSSLSPSGHRFPPPEGLYAADESTRLRCDDVTHHHERLQVTEL
jgi:hypothetical protein